MSERCHAHMDNPDYNTSTAPIKTKGTSSSKRDKWHKVKSQQKFMRLAGKQVAKILEIVLSNFLIWLSCKTPSGRNIIFVISVSVWLLLVQSQEFPLVTCPSPVSGHYQGGVPPTPPADTAPSLCFNNTWHYLVFFLFTYLTYVLSLKKVSLRK